MNDTTKQTLKWDMIRAIPLGLLESIVTTFGVLVVVRVFSGDQFSKAWVVAALPLGLLASPSVVQLVRRSGVAVGKAMCGLHIISAIGFSLIWLLGDNIVVYVIGVLLGSFGLASAFPLMAQVYKQNYPDEKRGRLFAYGGFVRKIFAITAALLGGWLLRKDLNNYQLLFGVFAFANVAIALISLKFEGITLDKTKKTNLFSAFRHVKLDKEFRNLLISWMFLGLGNLLCMALFVEYISNRVYGYDLDEFTIGMITTFVPEAVYLLVVMLWGNLFDKWNFYLLRATINLFFAAGVLVYFLGEGVWVLVVGIALHGIARAGGNVAWSLWVTKFSKPQYVAEYMSVHTFMTGCRGLAAPFIALPLALALPPQWITTTGACLIILATLMIAPNIRFQTKRREATEIEPDPR